MMIKKQLLASAIAAICAVGTAHANTYQLVIDGNVQYTSTQSVVLPGTGGTWFPPSVADPEPPFIIAGVAGTTSYDALDAFAVANPSAGTGQTRQMTLTIDSSGEVLNWAHIQGPDILGVFPTVVLQSEGITQQMDLVHTTNGTQTCTSTVVGSTITYECPLISTLEDDTGYVSDSSAIDAAFTNYRCASVDPYLTIPGSVANPWRPSDGNPNGSEPLQDPADPVANLLRLDGVTPIVLSGLNVLAPTENLLNTNCGKFYLPGGEMEAQKIVINFAGSLGEDSFSVTSIDQYQLNHSIIAGSFSLQAMAKASYGSIVSENGFSNGGKNVPAMGAFGLAALFGGLLSIAGLLRRRVSEA